MICVNSFIFLIDKIDVEWVIIYIEDVFCFLFNVIFYKENMFFIIGVLLINRKILVDVVVKYFKIVIDVFCFVVVLFEGDVSLVFFVWFKKFNWVERCFFLGLLE